MWQQEAEVATSVFDHLIQPEVPSFLACDHCTASVPEERLSVCDSFFAAGKLRVSCKYLLAANV